MVVNGKLPTLLEASVRELRVVDLPEDGLPTRPMRGSRGIVMGMPFRLGSGVYLRNWGCDIDLEIVWDSNAYRYGDHR